MKTLTILVATLILTLTMSGVSFAWYEKNPDHVTSIGLSIGLAGGGGTADVFASGATASQDISTGHFDISADFTSPLSNSMSIFGAASIYSNYGEQNETTLLAGTESSITGIALRGGVRIYFNK